jgi:phage portal protein BeeE
VGLLERVALERNGRKAWAGDPPFWSLDASRFIASYARDRESIENDYVGYVQGAYKRDGIVFACIDRRQMVFSQARFLWRPFTNGKPGDMFGSQELALLEDPWPNGTTGELLALMELDASLAGNFYATTVDESGRIGRAATATGKRIVRMRPDWCTLIVDAPSGNPYNVDARVVALMYETPERIGNDPLILLPGEYVHYSPKPDPMARFRGMSWLTPVITEVMADRAATDHKRKFFDNGAVPSFAIKFDKDTGQKAFDAFIARYNEMHAGGDNAYRTLFLTGGADVVPLSLDLKQLDFKATQGAGETRIAAAAGVPAAILGISEGLAGSSLNAGNFTAARRLFVDTCLRDLWGKASASLQNIVTPPRGGVRLWYSDDDISFLREDAADAAAIRQQDVLTARQLLDGGFKPDAVLDYMLSNDLGRLRGQHSGLFSVQLRPPGEMSTTPSTDMVPLNGAPKPLATQANGR